MAIDTDNVRRIVTNMRYKNEKDWLPLPAWCRSYIELGIELARYPRTDARLKVALALPTVAFATPFVALGVVIQSAHEAPSTMDYYEFIISRPLGTPVIYHRANNTRLRGTIEGFTNRNNRKYVLIRISQTDVLQITLRDNASRITVADTEFKLPLSQRGRRGQPIPDILSACMSDAVGFISKTYLSCLIIAQISDFRREATGLMIGIPHNGDIAHGTAQDILRVEQFLGTNQAYRCQVIATSESFESSASSELENPPITVFAGANSYLKHYAKWANSHQIVLLDRTERSFQDAVDNLNENYGRRLDRSSVGLRFNPPSGIDAMIFEENIQ